MMSFLFEIVLPDAAGMSFDVTSVTIDTRAGQITLLAGHADLITLTAKGRVTLRNESGEPMLVDAEAGMLYVSGGSVRLLTDRARPATAQ